MKAAVGYSTDNDAFSSGAQAMATAMEQGDPTRPDLCLAFCGGALDYDACFRGIRSVVGEATPIVGGSAIGIIANEHLAYTGYESAVMALWLEGVSCEVATIELGQNVRSSGEQLAASFTPSGEDRAFLFFYDSLKKPASDTAPPEMNPSPLLIEGLERQLGTHIPIWGAGLLGDFDFRVTPGQFCGAFSASNRLVGVLLGKGLKIHSRIIHGCNPLDGAYHRITRSEGAVVFEIDDRPAVEVIDELYGHQDWRGKHPVDLLTIGVNHGEKYGPFAEESYVNRLITGVLPDASGIVLFEPDLPPGTEIQFMLRDGARMIESAAGNVAEMMARFASEGVTPRFALYIDCAGRTARLSNTLTEEAAEIQNVLTQHQVPLLGFYTGVEIAPCLGRSRGLDWTGVLMIFTEQSE